MLNKGMGDKCHQDKSYQGSSHTPPPLHLTDPAPPPPPPPPRSDRVLQDSRARAASVYSLSAHIFRHAFYAFISHGELRSHSSNATCSHGLQCYLCGVDLSSCYGNQKSLLFISSGVYPLAGASNHRFGLSPVNFSSDV